MTPRQAAQRIGCSPQQVRTLIRMGKLKAVKQLRPDFTIAYVITPREVKRFCRLPTDGRSWKRGKTLSRSKP